MLGCAALGAPDGPLLLWFHGTPGSRFAVLPEQARHGGHRIVVVERPGYGLSTARPARKLLDFASDVRELLDALRVERATIAGVSGAGPYLAACGYAIPQRLERLVMISAAAPWAEAEVREGMSRRRRTLFAFARHAPRLFRWSIDAQRLGEDPARFLRAMSNGASAPDRAVLERTWDAQVAMVGEALRQGSAAFAWELHLAMRPWGFPLEGIRTEVHVLQGLEDHHTPPAMGRHLASRIPGARLQEIAGAGHYLYVDHWDAVRVACAGGSLRQPRSEAAAQDAR